MITRIRRWLGLPLLTKREQRNLTGFWYTSLTYLARTPVTDHDARQRQTTLAEEFLEAIEWLETL